MKECDRPEGRRHAKDHPADRDVPSLAGQVVRHLYEFEQAFGGHRGQSADEPSGGRTVHGPRRSSSRTEPCDCARTDDRAVLAGIELEEARSRFDSGACLWTGPGRWPCVADPREPAGRQRRQYQSGVGDVLLEAVETVLEANAGAASAVARSRRCAMQPILLQADVGGCRHQSLRSKQWPSWSNTVSRTIPIVTDTVAGTVAIGVVTR